MGTRASISEEEEDEYNSIPCIYTTIENEDEMDERYGLKGEIFNGILSRFSVTIEIFTNIGSDDFHIDVAAFRWGIVKFGSVD